jgi:cell wall-associated NlpC family hydrolase
VNVFGELAYSPHVRNLLATIGVPYAWGKGQPSTPWPPAFADCSGYAQMALVELGLLKSTEPDRNALGLANACDPVSSSGPVVIGDLAFYGVRGSVTHVMVCLDEDWCIGATGGDANTKGDDPTAYVMVKKIHYRRDWLVNGRIKPQFRPGHPIDPSFV